MKLTATVKLLPTPEQRQSLLHTLETANAACNWISDQAWQTKTYGRVPVHHLTYDGVRKLKRLSGREARFAKDVNHTISKRLVAKAQDTARGIALENLTHIRSRVTVQRAQRATLHSWSFFQLRAFITYKAQRVGVPVVLVDPRNTSRQCAVCGHIDKANRPKQDVFLCTSCGHAAHADVNAAVNIGRRAAVNPPNAVGDLGSDPA